MSKSIQWAPSISWLFFMVIPALLWGFPMNFPGAHTQLVAITLAFLFLYLSDKFSFKRALIKSSDSQHNALLFWLAAFGAAYVVIFSVINLILMPKIPLLVLIGSHTKFDLANARRNATLMLQAPFWLSYFFNWITTIAGPVSVVSLLKLKQYGFAFILTLWIFLYEISTTAIMPLVLFFVTIIFTLMICRTPLSSFAWRLVRFAVCVGVLMMLLVAVSEPNFFQSIIPNGQKINLEQNDLRSYDSVADKFRFDREKSINQNAVLRLSKYMTYRVWLTPFDVSARWYQYFTSVSKPIGLESILFKSDFSKKPPNLVGTWIYTYKFPKSYLSYVNAYASFDADAYSRMGFVGVVFAVLFVALLRYSLIELYDFGAGGRICYGVCLSMLTFLPFQASLQSILVAHGLLIFIFLLVLKKANFIIGIVFNNRVSK